MPRTKQRTPQLREHVLEVALATLASEAVVGFTTRKVAHDASTSTPAVYELFGDKTGLVREVFFEGFRQLRHRFDALDESDDPRADLIDVIGVIRAFVREHPVLADVMFSRPFADFDPGPDELSAGSGVREFIVARVQRAVHAGTLNGDPTDSAHPPGSRAGSRDTRDRRVARDLERVDGSALDPGTRGRLERASPRKWQAATLTREENLCADHA